MNAIRYALFSESAEISERSFKKHQGDIIDALFEKDRDGGSIIKTFDSKESALSALQEYKCTAFRSTGFSGIAFYYCDYYYIEQQQYDDDYDDYLINDEFCEYAAIDENVYNYLRSDEYDEKF